MLNFNSKKYKSKDHSSYSFCFIERYYEMIKKIIMQISFEHMTVFILPE